jgi:GNAT superfamily N-acetyltransferase
VSITIRAAKPADSALIFSLIRELAEYERLSHDVTATEQQIAAELFAPQPRVFCDLAAWNGETVGFAVWFLIFSTFSGRQGLYLEDVFVRPAFRGKGIGKTLMRNLARRCVEQNLARFEWTVLDWNTPSIDFYRSLGANVLEQWRICRMTGEALEKLAGGGRQ